MRKVKNSRIFTAIEACMMSSLLVLTFNTFAKKSMIATTNPPENRKRNFLEVLDSIICKKKAMNTNSSIIAKKVLAVSPITVLAFPVAGKKML